MSTETIREGDAYTGVRTSIRATLATARLHFHVDVNVGDPIWPGSQRVFVPRLLSGEAIELEGYPLAMVLAEKVVTAIQRGEANTRWRDFADVLLIAAKHPVAGADFHSALTRVASFRRTPLRPLADSMSGFDARADRQWQLWRRKHGLVERVPRALADVAKAVSAFADQAISGAVAERRWAPADGAWIPIARS